MCMALTLLSGYQNTLNRPTRPSDPNGIAHATNTGTPSDTKADRATTKLAYATWLATWKTASGGDATHELEFTTAGSGITYADD